jgi:magnesium chelatase family protein
VRERVIAARLVRAAAPPRAGDEAADLLERAVERLPLSARGRSKVLVVASTIAALAQSKRIEAEHLAEALSYRSPRELNAS